MTGEPCDRCGEPIPPGKRRHARFCSRNCQKRAHDNIPKTCPDCGAVAWRRSARCLDCENRARRDARAARDEDIILMWNEGMSQADIAAELDYGPNSSPPELSRLMREGRIQARRAAVRAKHAAH